MKHSDFAQTISIYLTEYLPGLRNVSQNTIKSYRDVIRQFLIFLQNERKIKVNKIDFNIINRDTIIDYLNWLEKSRGVSIQTRNQRLAVIHSFFKYVQIKNPDFLFVSQQIIGIPFKKHEKKQIEFLTLEQMKILLSQPNINSKKGLRDRTLIAILYDSGARVQELIDLKVSDIRLDSPPTIKLTGKGRKVRIVPIMNKTALLITEYFNKNNLFENGKQSLPVFHNKSLNKFTRPGITYILKKYYALCIESNDIYWPDNLHPHMLRHSKAIHLLESGVPLIYIRDFLGHVSVTTTEIYIRASVKIKNEAIEKMYSEVIDDTTPQWSEDKELINWLKELCE
jgi:site-specific recombinase XerD